VSVRPPLVIATQKLSGLSGKVALVRENARILARRGWSVEVLAQSLDRHAFACPEWRARRLVSLHPFSRQARLDSFSRRVVRRARRAGALLVGHGESLFEQDVLHVHNCVHLTHEAIHGRPLAPDEERVAARAQRRILSEGRFQRVIANSQLTAEELTRRYGIAAESITVVHPGHDPERFHPRTAEQRQALRRALGAQPEELLVGLVTSGDFTKRAVGPFLSALGGVPEEVKTTLRVLVVGKESRLDPYREAAREAGLVGRVDFLPPRPDVESLYPALDLYVHPAHFEEFGMSVLEAMACGTAVLTSARVGAAERLAGEARDELISHVEVQTLRAALCALLTDPARRRALAQAGLDAAHDCTWEANARAHERCYVETAEALAVR